MKTYRPVSLVDTKYSLLILNTGFLSLLPRRVFDRIMWNDLVWVRHTYIHKLYVYRNVNICWNPYTSVGVHMYTRTHVRMHTCTHVHMHACKHVRMYACTHVHMYACTHVHICACTHVRMYTCTRYAGLCVDQLYTFYFLLNAANRTVRWSNTCGARVSAPIRTGPGVHPFFYKWVPGHYRG
jgi:hypothetical protein